MNLIYVDLELLFTTKLVGFIQQQSTFILARIFTQFASVFAAIRVNYFSKFFGLKSRFQTSELLVRKGRVENHASTTNTKLV